MEKARLFNIVNPDKDRSYYSVKFYAGDILSIQADVLVLSAVKEDYEPMRGTVLESIYQQYDFLLSDLQYEEISRNIKLFDVEELATKFRKIIVIEFHKFDEEIAESEYSDLIFNRFNELIAHLPSGLGENDSSISFPLIGTGQQALSKEKVAIELLKLSRNTLHKHLEEFNIFVYDSDAMQVVNQYINEYLQLEELNEKDDVFHNIKSIVKRLAEKENGYVELFDSLHGLLEAPNTNIVSIAIFGRKICEHFTADLMRHYNIEYEKFKTLNEKLTNLTPHLTGDDYPQIVSYLRLLQSFGNVAAHQINHDINTEDMLSICLSIKRINDHFIHCDIGTQEVKF